MLLQQVHAWFLSAMLALAPAASLASQNQLSSPTTGTVSGLQLTNNYNNALDSLNTCNSGVAAPTNQLSGLASLGNCWLNTTSSPYPLGMNDGSVNWPKIGALDATNHYWDMQIGGGALNIASATTTDLCSVPQNYLTITGSLTITGFGSTCPAGVAKLITFNNVLTLTYNATSLIIPGAANVSTTAGDQAILVALGGGNWQVQNYTPSTGQALINPAVPVGTKLDFFGGVVPAHYTLAFGQTISRASFPLTLAAFTNVQSVTRTNGSPTVTGFTDTTLFGASQPVEGAGIPASSTILSCTATTCTLSANASSSGTANLTVFYFGDGDGSTTFNMPDCRGVLTAGRDNMGGTARGKLTTAFALANPDALGMTLGGQSQTLTAAQLPAISITPTFTGTQETWNTNQNNVDVGSAGVNVGGGGVPNFPTGTQMLTTTVTPHGAVSAVAFGSGNAHTVVPPAITANCMVRTD